MGGMCPIHRWDTGGKFCWKCGSTLVTGTFNCPYCKAKVDLVNSFCQECGRPVQKEIKEFLEKIGEGGEKSVVGKNAGGEGDERSD